MPNSPDNPRRLSRRDFLRIGAVAAGATIGRGIVAALGASGTEDIQAASQKPPYSPGPRAAIKDLQVITKDISVPVVEKTPVVSNSNAVSTVKNEIKPDVKIAIPVFRVETDVDNGFGVEGAKKIEGLIGDIEDYYLKTFGPAVQATEGPILVAKAPKNSNPRAYSYGESENYPNGAIFVQSPDAEIDLAHEIKHKWPLPYEDSKWLTIDLMDHLEGEKVAIAVSRQWGIDRRGNESQELDEWSLLYQAKRRDKDFFVKLNDGWIKAGRPDAGRVDKETWTRWAEEVSPGFGDWLKRAKEGPQVDREKYKNMKFVWNGDAESKLDDEKYVRWYDEGLDWFMPDCSQSCVDHKRLGPNKYLVTRFADATIYPGVGPAGSLPHGELLMSFSTDNEPLGKWVNEKNF